MQQLDVVGITWDWEAKADCVPQTPHERAVQEDVVHRL
jgi:hypothetical protein